jgi:arylsulfatase A-like enzyme
MRLLLAAALAGGLTFPALAQSPPKPHNVILFVADGLRPGMVNERTAPAMAGLMQRGVRFTNTHSLFPTFTTANASAMATGHQLGDTGDFSNNIYVGFAVAGAGGAMVAPLENDRVLGEVDQHFGGDFLNEETILKAARGAGFSTAALGKLGPTLIFDHTERTGEKTVIFDDATGRPNGIPLSEEVAKRLASVGLPPQTPARGDNSKPDTTVANVEQQAYFTDVTTKALLPMFKERSKPFVLVFWSRDPDGTQHGQGDSPNRLVPGINGPTSLAAIRNADDCLGRLIEALNQQGLAATTDVILTSDHGFSTISKESATSWAARQSYKDVPAGQLPPGFVAIDLAHALGLKLFDAKGAEVADGAHASHAMLADDPKRPSAVVAGNGGSDLIYLPTADKALAARIVATLAEQDYVSGMFVDDALGKIPGTLPLSTIGLRGSAVTPTPSIVVNFRSFSTGCADPTTCGVEVADTGLKQGQGMHGSFSRADTRNTMGAAGPSFRQRFEAAAPASNADLGRTIARLLGLKVADKGKLTGRVLTEALPNGAMPAVQSQLVRSEPDAGGRITVLATQTANGTRYFDAAGYPGRTLGLPAEPGR